MKRWAIVLSLFSFSCGGGQDPPPPPTPQPTPTAVATPTPWVPPAPLDGVRVVGDSFVYRDRPVDLLGVVNCDYAAEWSIAPPASVQTMVDHGARYTHIRLGPFWTELEPAVVRTLWADATRPLIPLWTTLGVRKVVDIRTYDSAYAIDEATGLADLTRWNPVFWGRIDKLLKFTSGLPQPWIVEIDLICAWILERMALSPWAAPNNVQGISCGGVGVLKRAPAEIHARFVREAVRRTGWAPVVYQTGNETSDADGQGSSQAWEHGVRAIVRSECQAHGYPMRPVGTNAEDPDIEAGCDYASRHKQRAQYPAAYPVWVNEYNDAALTPGQWRNEAELARELGTTYHLWRCHWSDQEYERALQYLRELRK